MSPRDLDVLRRLVPQELVNAIVAAHAADAKRSAAAMADSVPHAEYEAAKAACNDAFLKVGELTHDWLVCGDDPIVSVEDEEAAKARYLAAFERRHPGALAATGDLAAEIEVNDRRASLRVLDGGRS